MKKKKSLIERIKRKNTVTNLYKCPWCRTEFECDVRKVMGLSGGKRQAVSSQVKCIHCGNFMKTWE